MTRSIRLPALLRCLGLLGLLVGWAGPARAAPALHPDDPRTACRRAIDVVRSESRVPAGLLEAVALAESGRSDAGSRRSYAWPWTVTAGGAGTYLDSKAEAIAHVERLRRAGRTNIDVGCMQINLVWHPDAFPDLETAFDPLANVGYGAAFLESLYEEARSWSRAVERYHTRDPERGEAYRGRVYATWGRSDSGPAEPVRIATGLDPPTLPRELPPRLINRNAAQAVWRWLTPAPLAPVRRLAPAVPLVVAGPAPPGARAGIPGLVVIGGGLRRAVAPGAS